MSLLPIPDVPLLLRGWRDDNRRLRVVAKLGLVDFSAFCRVASSNEDSFALAIGNDARDMIGFSLKLWRFAFMDAPPNDNEILGETIESAILGVHSDTRLTLFLFLLEDKTD